MNCFTIEKGIRLASTETLCPIKTFSCGQCFRWQEDGAGTYTGIVCGHAASVWVRDGGVYIDTDRAAERMWRRYFDLDTDYEAAHWGPEMGAYFAQCAEFGRGIRILRQDPWEALCSFILSQCNNIPRIQRIVETLCREFGSPIRYRERTLYRFPSPEVIAALTIEDLSPLRCGYRAPYVLTAARAVASGKLDLDSLAAGSTASALQTLCTLPGVGKKVASCVVLFGLHKLDAFPVDIWMKRALRTHFPRDFDPGTLGPYAGVAQQYIFYYARSVEK
jgi:N-glycosylase/DNA lyase